MSESSPCRLLDWDTDFFGVKIARLDANHLSRATVEEALEWGRRNAIECLYFLAGSDDVDSVRLAEEKGFRLVDVRITLDMRLSPGVAIGESEGGSGVIRPHVPEDVPALRAIAAEGHHDSRFYYDPNFPRAKCAALYETWIEKSCGGYADVVLVAEVEGQAAGYISCHLQAKGEGQIGLVGIATPLQGQGLGGRLVNAALRWFVEQGASHVTVVTQGRNTAAQRLYQRCGFVTRETQLWYHRWFPV